MEFDKQTAEEWRRKITLTPEEFAQLMGDTEESKPYWSVKTHYPNLDELFKGFKSGNLVGIGGKHAVGKSALALNLALRMAEHGTKVCLVSFEMLYKEVTARLLARMTGIGMAALQSRDLTQAQTDVVNEARDRLNSLPLEICDSSSMTVDSIREVARKSFRGCDEGILIIDCLQLIRPSTDCGCYEDDDAKLESVVIALKRLAMAFRIPVIIVDQLEQTESLDDAYPLSEYADVIMFLNHARRNLNSCEGTSGELWLLRDLHIAKFRQGPMGGTLRLNFAPRLMAFIEE